MGGGWRMEGKKYIFIKNTQQNLLVFIQPTFPLESVRKTTPELLSAVLRSFLCGVCVYFTSTSMIVSCVHCTVGWVNFALF